MLFPSHEFNAGQSNDVVYYHHGHLTLRYVDGDQYSDGTPRTSEIAFYCDESAGAGEPKFTSESGMFISK